MQNKTRLELADYEAENLAKLQKLLSRKWEFIYMQAEAQIKVDKKRDKMERKIIDSQERAFWDVHRPAPGCVNTTECDMRKTLRTRLSIDYQYLLSQKHYLTAKHKSPSLGSTTTSSSLSNQTVNNFSNKIASVINTPTSSITAITTDTSGNNNSSCSSSNTSNATATTSTTSENATAAASSVTMNATNTQLSEKDELLTLYNLRKEIDFLKRRLERRYVKTSKVSER